MKALQIFICLVMLISCNEELVTETLSVKTGGAAVGTKGGVTLKGSLTAFEKVEEYGFVLSESPTFDYTWQWAYYPLGRPTSSGSFHVDIGVGLDQIKYYYRAFVRTGNKWTYGEALSFTYPGDKPPKITSISPTVGHVDDTVLISGENFKEYYSEVLFGTSKAEIIETTSHYLKCLVPKGTNSGISKVFILHNGLTAEASQTFNLYSPEITSISPSSGTFRGFVEIHGKHFELQDERNIVTFGSTPAIVLLSSRELLRVVVPDNLTTVENIISVRAQNKTVISLTPFKVKPPEISNSPLHGFTMQAGVINGNNFNPVYYKNKVFFGGTQATVLGTSTDKRLDFTVPAGPYTSRDVTIQVEVLGVKSNAAAFTVEDPWLMVTNTLPFSYYGSVGAFGLNGKGYVIAADRNGGETPYLWTMNASDLTWTKQTIPVALKWSGIAMTNGTKIYLYTATASNSFWEFDVSTNTWTQLDSYPGARRDKPGMFTIGEDIYIGWGSDFEPYTPIMYTDFYRYRPSTGDWEQIATLNEQSISSGRTETSSFTIDGYGYIGCGARNTGQYDFWRYDPVQNVWSRMADFGPRNYTASFQLNGKGYIANGGSGGYNDCWEYNPLTNSWRRIDDIGYRGRYRGFSFVVNGVPFAGGGDGVYSTNNPVNYEMFMLDVNRMK